MTKYEISKRVLELLNCDADEVIDAIYNLANEIEKEAEQEDE